MFVIPRICYYDSLGDVDSSLYLNSSLLWLQEMAIELHKVSLSELSGGIGWTLNVVPVNHQKNGSDCGVHTLMNIYCLAFSIPLVCCVENAEVRRDKTAMIFQEIAFFFSNVNST